MADVRTTRVTTTTVPSGGRVLGPTSARKTRWTALNIVTLILVVILPPLGVFIHEAAHGLKMGKVLWHTLIAFLLFRAFPFIVAHRRGG
jgi:uncharacterized membrane protein YqaE (UPF0057 family)